MNPKLSIIIPCYNLGEYLYDALNSIASYSNKEDYEIIIVNDGSTNEKTLDILKDVESQGVFVLHQENMEVGKARNNGINLAKGEYILPLDADNKLRSIYISKSIQILESNPELDIVYSDRLEFGLRNKEVSVPNFNFPKLCYRNYIDCCAIFRKSVWEKVNGYDEHMPIYGLEDWDFWLRCAINGARFYHLDEIGYEYRVRDDSKTATVKDKHDSIINYIQQKKELSIISEVSKSYLHAEELRRIKNSRSYRWMNHILNKIKKI